MLAGLWLWIYVARRNKQACGLCHQYPGGQHVGHFIYVGFSNGGLVVVSVFLVFLQWAGLKHPDGPLVGRFIYVGFSNGGLVVVSVLLVFLQWRPQAAWRRAWRQLHLYHILQWWSRGGLPFSSFWGGGLAVVSKSVVFLWIWCHTPFGL